MKNTILALSLAAIVSCSGRDEPVTPPENPSNITYTKSDAVGTWKVTHYDNPNNDLAWEVERNNRTITFKSDDKFTSYSLMESFSTDISGNFVIDTKGNIKTTNLNVDQRTLDMNLTDRKNAIITIMVTPGYKLWRKYKVVKQ